MKQVRMVQVAVAAVAIMSVPVSATWLKATSRHFVVYSDMDEASLRRQASELEQFDAVLRHIQHLPDDPDAEFNRLTVYVLPTVSAVQSLSHDTTIAGFYLPRVTGSVAFTPRRGEGQGINALTPRIVLFHEYTHHFLRGNYTKAFPAWFSEGYAEFASTVSQKDGDFQVGAAAQHRADGLFYTVGMNATQLFAPPAHMSPDQAEKLYGRGWLLTHLIEFDPAFGAQFARYITLLNDGTPSVNAATEAFGNLKALDKRLDAYLVQRQFKGLTIRGAAIAVPQVAVEPLTPGQAAMIRLRMESTHGVDGTTAGPLYARAKAVAAPYRSDPMVQGWLAEMALDAGDDAGAEAAADAALEKDPVSSQALLYKARAHLKRLVAAKSSDSAAWAEARGWIIKANRAQANDAAALMLFYESFLMQGVPPSKGAVSGLYRAAELVPQDDEVRFLAARSRIAAGETNAARTLLRPLAFDPHAGSDNEAAKLLATLDAAKPPEPAGR